MNLKHLALAAAIIAASACIRETQVIHEESNDSIVLTFTNAPLVESTAWTKGKNPVELQANNIVGASLAVYDCYGKLVHTDAVEGVFDGFGKTLSLHKEQKYSCFIVTGYIAGQISWPDDIQDIEAISIENTTTNADDDYDMTSTLRDYGLDRAGKLLELKPKEMDGMDGSLDGNVHIPIESLWAKVEVAFDGSDIVDLDTGLHGSAIQSCGARYGNRVFRPFATSSSLESGNKFSLLPIETRTAAGGIPSGSFIFYIPENMLGDLLPDNNFTDEKTPSKVGALNGEAAAMAAEKSAVEFTGPAIAAWGDEGRLTYRFCLGSDLTSNFDIKRNTIYTVNLKATADGYIIKDWKAGLELTDTRDLDLVACSATAEVGNMTITQGSSSQVALDKTFFLIPCYTQGGTSQTADAFGAEGGWALTPQTQELLADYDISCSLQEKYIYVETLGGGLHFEDDPAAGNAVYFEGKAAKTTVLAFSPAAELEEGMVLPIAIATADGRHSKTVTIRTRADGSAVVEWVRIPEYIAQKGQLSTASVSGSVVSVSYSVPEEYASIITIEETSSSCTVNTKAGGNAMIKYQGLSAAGTVICEGFIPLTVKAPVLHSGTELCQLQADGTVVNMSPYYTDEDGHSMTVAANENNGYGLRFTPSGYAAYLQPEIVIEESGAGPFLGCSGLGLWVARFNATSSQQGAEGKSVEALMGTTTADAISVKARNANAVNRVYCDVKIKSPVGYIGTDRKLCTLENHILTSFNSARNGAVAINKGQTVTAATGIFSYGATLASLSIESLPDLDFSLGQNGSLSVTGKSSPLALSAGRKTLNVICRNTHSGETMAIPSGYIDIYLHMAPVAVLNLQQTDPRVYTDIDGQPICPAVSSLKTSLQGREIVSCAFDNGSFYNLGYGMWNYLDETDSSGNQHFAPEQGGMMTVFYENNWPNKVKIGDLAYSISIGTIELDEGKYRSADFFYAYNERPWIRFDYTGLPFLTKSPVSNHFYHYTYGQERDSNGLSYYILDLPTIPRWR